MSRTLQVSRSLFSSLLPAASPEGAGCRVCGACCERFSGVLMACGADLARWSLEGRDDLLSRVGKRGDLWMDPATGLKEKVCPFLSRSGENSALCQIHSTKPAICRSYPGPYQGFRCLRGARFPITPSLSADRPLLA